MEECCVAQDTGTEDDRPCQILNKLSSRKVMFVHRYRYGVPEKL